MPTKSKVIALKGAEIEAKPIHWLWNGFLPAGKLTILAGAGGTGKSTIAFSLAAIVTNGGIWPDHSRCERPGNVLIFSTEDDADDTIVPRMQATYANADRYSIVTGTLDENGQRQPFDPSQDVKLLKEAAESMGGVSLLIIDPIVSVVGKDMHRANDVRSGLQPVVDFAAETGCAVLGISHFAKGGAGKNPTERVIGSQAFSALARMVLVAAKEEDGTDRVMVRAKSNNSIDTGGFRYQIEPCLLPMGSIATIRVLWLEGLSGTSRDILAQIEGTEERPAINQREMAESFLTIELQHGPRYKDELMTKAKQMGIGEKAMRTARERMNLATPTNGFQGKTLWSLPFNVALPSTTTN